VIALAATAGLSACNGDGASGAAPPATTAGATSSSSATTSTVSPTTSTTAPPVAQTPEGVSPQPPLVTPTFDQSGESTSTSTQAEVLDWLPGDPSGACVNADGGSELRSGGIGAGSFDEAVESFARMDGSASVALHWIPAHGEDLDGLTVNATQISGGTASFEYEQTDVSDLVDESGAWRYYYNTEFTIPSAGQWRFEASSGTDAGCFIVTFAN